MTIHFALLISRQGKVRLAKWYTTFSNKDKAQAVKEVTTQVVGRPSKLCNFLDWKDYHIIYKRYASLYFIICVDKTDNELIAMETIHHYVEVLDRYFGNVYTMQLTFVFRFVNWI